MNGRKASKAGAGTHAARQIGDRLGKIQYDTYVDPFLGLGDIYRASPPKSTEILADRDCKRVAQARQKSCRSTASCERIKKARVSCGRDWKTYLKHDSPSTLFVFDPPWEKVATANMNYHQNGIITAAEVARRGSKLKGGVAIYYKNTPETRRALCKRPYRCSLIKGNILGRKFTQLLAVKSPSGRVSRYSSAKNFPSIISLTID